MTDTHPALMDIARPDGTYVKGLRKAGEIAKMDGERRAVDVVLSTESVDRDGDIIRQDGWDLSAYDSNPTVLAYHDPSKPIARGENVRVEGGRLVGTMVFPPKGHVALSDEIFALYEAGALSAVSVGFMPIEMEPLKSEDGRGGYDIRRAELFEFSAVSVPSNREALRRMKAKGGLAQTMDALDQYLEAAADPDARRAYIEIVGEPHPSQSADLAKQFEAKGDDEDEDNDKASEGERFTTTGGEDHEHDFVLGMSETEEAGDPPHVHAIQYDDGTAMIQPQDDGHTHEAPEGAVIEPDEEEDGGGDMEPEERAADDPDEKSAIVTKVTDFPEKGDDLAVSLRNSQYPRFPRAEAQALKANWPEIWEKGGNIEGDEAFRELTRDNPPEARIRKREAWAARHLENFRLAGVVAQIKWLVVGERGLTHMRRVIAEEKDKILARREREAGIEIVKGEEPVEQKAGLSLTTEDAQSIAEIVGGAVREGLRRGR